MKASIGALLLGLLLVFASGCATTKKTHLADHLGAQSSVTKILPVEFIPQEKNMCGPSVLKMATAVDAPNFSLDQLKQMTFREEAQGSFKADILSSARRMGLAPYRTANLSSMFEQIDRGRPVIVFQNLGLSWMAAWHFALLIGYDSNTDEVYLHTGQTAAEKMTLSRFIGTWERGELWSYVILPPDEVPRQSHLQEATDNALLFEKLARPDLAKKVYQAAIVRWPESFEPHLGLAGLLYQEKNLKAAISESETALKLSPEHPALLYNLSYLYFEAGQKQKAHAFKERTLASVPAAERDEYLKKFTF